MHIANILAELIGSALFVTGLTMFNRPYFNAAISDLANNKGLLWITGLITFVMGTVIVALYNVWSMDWRVIVTILGWLTVIKGAVIVLFPQSLMRIYRALSYGHLLTSGGIYSLVLGAILFLLGFTT